MRNSRFVTYTPKDYQWEGIDYINAHPYSILADEQGLGKTLQALYVAFAKARKGEKILIVCPAFLRINWWLEVEAMSKHFYDVSLRETSKEVLAPIDTETDIVIISYSQVSKAEHIFEWCDFVIADEAHYLKNMESGRGLSFHRYVYEYCPGRLLLLTGTPVENSTIDFYSLLRLMGYTPTPTNGLNILDKYDTFDDFCEQFAHPFRFQVTGKRGQKFTMTKYRGVKNLKELLKYKEGKYLRREAKDVLDLPPINEKEIFVQYKEDKRLAKAFEEFNRGEAKDTKAKAKSAVLKAKYCAEYAKNLHDQGLGPIIIYTDHVEPSVKIAEKLGVKPIHGQVSQKDRASIVKRFQAGELDYFVSTIGAGAEGITLTKGNQMVLNDLSWNPSKNSQVFRRFYRIGQEKTCWLHFLYGSIQDKRIKQNLQGKKSVIDSIV